jgi:tRNA/rRNA methyltransferase
MMQQAIASGGRTAIVFGPEKHGLTREDLSFCNVLVEIPTNPKQPSMNLGQAAAVCLYELVRNAGAVQGKVQGLPPNRHETAAWMRHPEFTGNPGVVEQPTVGAARSAVLDRLGDLIEEVMLASDYSPASMRSANRHDVRLLLRRLNLSNHDVRRVMGLFRRILHKLSNGQSK